MLSKFCSQGCYLLCKASVIVVPIRNVVSLVFQLFMECKFLVPVLKSNDGISCILEPAAHPVNEEMLKEITDVTYRTKFPTLHDY